MSLYANIDHLAAASGVVALAIDNPGHTRTFRGDQRWSAILEGSVKLLGLTDESTIRLVIGEHTLVVQKELDEVVAVVLPTGHAIAKSLRRMIRRMARKDRGPFVPRVEPMSTADMNRPPTQPKVAPQTLTAPTHSPSVTPSRPTTPGVNDPRYSS
ncbi:MAG: hypothetical protein R3B09_30005 [Nannocystaceae bacterium]